MNIRRPHKDRLLSADYPALIGLGGLMLYAFAGSPTPDNPGIVEIMIAASLIIAAGMRGMMFTLGGGNGNSAQDNAVWAMPLRLFAAVGLFVPTSIAFLNGNDAVSILRDLAAFSFVILPLFLYPRAVSHDRYPRFLIAGVALLGLAFAARSLFDFVGMAAGGQAAPVELHYFANAPSVLFTALIFIGVAAQKIWRAAALRDIAVAGGAVLLSALPLLAMALAVQRASLMAIVIFIVILICIGLARGPARTGAGVLILAAIAGLLWPVINSLYGLLSEKTMLVGLNMRGQEWAAVWDVVSSGPVSLLAGLGWGGAFHNPAVGGLSVNYTHSFLSAMLLKGGGIMLITALIMLFAFGRKSAALFFNRPVFILAVSFPLLIQIILYASYKSLDFGLLLLCLGAAQAGPHERLSKKTV